MWIDYRRVFLESMFTTLYKNFLYLWGTGGKGEKIWPRLCNITI